VAAGREPLRLTAWAALALVVALLHNRLWATPNLAFFTAIADHLGTNPFGRGFDGDYLLTNLSGPAVARLLGQTAPHEYARLHLLLLLVGLAIVVAAAYRRFGYTTARLLLVLVAASPALTVTMQWLGQPDALTFPLALGLVVARRRWTVFAVAVALGLTHAEQGVVAALVAVAARLALDDSGSSIAPTDGSVQRNDRFAERFAGQNGGGGRMALLEAVPLLGGIAAGRLLVELYFRLEDIVVTNPRTSFLDLGVSGFAEHHLKSHGVLVYALWGPLWIGIAVAALRFVRSGASWPDDLRRRWGLLGVAALLALVPMLLTLDETRVYSLTTAPLLVAGAVLSRRTIDRVPTARLTAVTGPSATGAVAAAALLLAVSPGLFTAGETYVSYNLPPQEFARFLTDGEHPDDLTGWLLHPFGFEVPSKD